MFQGGTTMDDSRPANSPEQGLALLLCLMALSLFSLLGLSMAINASTALRIGDNFEAQSRARYAAMAGLAHARGLLRGLRFSALLAGPDGTHDAVPAYLALARSHSFRNPVDWPLARSLDLADPYPQLLGLPDDGLIHDTGTAPGAEPPWVPLGGLVLPGLSPAAPPEGTYARYFVKVTDNNGESSEVSADPGDSPFVDGDGTIIIRSLGLARTLVESVGPDRRWNSVSVFEARFRRSSTFDLEAALVLLGTDVMPSGSELFEGVPFVIDGGASNPGIGTADLDPGDGMAVAQRVLDGVAVDQRAMIRGGSLAPSIQEIGGTLRSHPDKSLLFDPGHLEGFLRRTAPRCADNLFSGSVVWGAGIAPDLGFHDPGAPSWDRRQRPRMTFVDGDLTVAGAVSGAGMLVVSGRMVVTGGLAFDGIVLVLGEGNLSVGGPSTEIRGGVLVGNLPGYSGSSGVARLTFGDGARLTFDRDMIRLGLSLLPALQVSFREITATMDP